MQKFIFRLILLICFFTTSFAGNMNHLRGQRYCEILLGGKVDNFKKSLHVYNTIGLNDCPQELWSKIDPEKIKQEYAASGIKLNGPRVWTIDGIKASSFVNPQIKTFNGIAMREAGILELPLRDLIKKHSPFEHFTVQRNTTWVYEAGKPVYELIAPNGNVYLMQSFSLEKINQSLEDLSNLNSKLKLPKGWRFQVKILEKDYLLTPINQKAIVIQDNFLNTYQMKT